MNFKSYPKVKDTPNRKSRKSDRGNVFKYNKMLNHNLKKQRRLERNSNESVYENDDRT